jgi:hypothetical protein
MHETIHRKRIASMQERTNSDLDVATMVMLLDIGVSLKGYRRVRGREWCPVNRGQCDWSPA